MYNLKAFDICQQAEIKNRPFHHIIPVDYSPMKNLSVDIKFMPIGFYDFKYLLVTVCE